MKKVKYLVRDLLRSIIGRKGYTYLRFIITHRYWPNLENPRSFSEKIIHRKFNEDPLKISKYVDKYTVREYVNDTVGASYLIPLLKKSKTIVPSDFSDLPESFVIKTSNGGGGENVMLVKDKSKIDVENICKKFNGYLKIKIGDKIDEPFYDIETPHIIFEELIQHEDGRYPSDYKLHIFNGASKKLIIQVDSDRFGEHKRSLFDENKNELSFNIQPKYDPIESSYVFPDNFQEVIEIARKLSQPFKYVRVDMYNVDGKVYFGELTFCHGSGWEPLSSKQADFLLGKYWS